MVTDEFLIVSNADGQAPGVYFYDHNLRQIRYFTYPALTEAPYNLEVSEDFENRMLQLFVAGPNSIQIIEQTKSRQNDNYFNLVD